MPTRRDEDGPLRLDEAGLARLVDRLAALAGSVGDARVVVGIAGIPGSGKSTLAGKLLAGLDARMPDAAALVPMDGFHFTNNQLDRLGLRQRKGAPQTFDARGYVNLLAAARDAAFVGLFPVYDRALHEPVTRDVPGQRIDAKTRLILTEGNYLLLRDAPWCELAAVLRETWLLETPIERARAWLVDRHVRGGRTRADAEAHVERSDALNIRVIQEGSREPDLRMVWG
ncbi:MAG: nucleoside/nucleotide kinase family protein [Planctomycetota bacterium]|nr:nucleoside/nucleotide kinase family protein [Planctomycetota bacterium]